MGREWDLGSRILEKMKVAEELNRKRMGNEARPREGQRKGEQ